jgi:hypothetical protein
MILGQSQTYGSQGEIESITKIIEYYISSVNTESVNYNNKNYTPLKDKNKDKELILCLNSLIAQNIKIKCILRKISPHKNQLTNDEFWNKQIYGEKQYVIRALRDQVFKFYDKNIKDINDKIESKFNNLLGKYYQAIIFVIRNIELESLITEINDIFKKIIEEFKDVNNIDLLDNVILAFTKLQKIKDDNPFIFNFVKIKNVIDEFGNKCKEIHSKINLFINNLLINELNEENINKIISINTIIMNIMKSYSKLSNTEYKEDQNNLFNKKIKDFKEILKIQNNINSTYEYIKNNKTLTEDVLENKWNLIKKDVSEIEKLFEPYKGELKNIKGVTDINTDIMKAGNSVFQNIAFKEEKDNNTNTEIVKIEPKLDKSLTDIKNLKYTITNDSCNKFKDLVEEINKNYNEITTKLQNFNFREDKRIVEWQHKYNNNDIQKIINDKKKELRC